MSTTDTSLINVLLRYGIIPLIIFVLILVKMYRKAPPGILTYTMIVYLISSLNIDAILRHNSILFLTILYFIVQHGKK